MLTVVVGLTGALVYGAADFFGGLAARRINPMLVTGIAALTGLVLLLAVGLPVFGGVWSPDAILLGSLSGVAGAVAIALLYASLAIGPMSILSPLTAVVSAIVPLVWGLVGGERLGVLGYVALGLALVAVVLVGFVPSGSGELVRGAVRPTLRGVLMGVGAGAAIGVFLVLLDASPDDSGVVPLILNRVVNAVIVFAAVGVVALLARRRGTRMQPLTRAALMLTLACGVLDVTANALLLIGVRIGDLSVMAVLAALYPAGTIILAAVVLKERIAVLQYVGLVLAIAAAAMLALG
jgi:drug/metabolite transporter (DMT)-like permease